LVFVYQEFDGSLAINSQQLLVLVAGHTGWKPVCKSGQGCRNCSALSLPVCEGMKLTVQMEGEGGYAVEKEMK